MSLPSEEGICFLVNKLLFTSFILWIVICISCWKKKVQSSPSFFFFSLLSVSLNSIECPCCWSLFAWNRIFHRVERQNGISLCDEDRKKGNLYKMLCEEDEMRDILQSAVCSSNITQHRNKQSLLSVQKRDGRRHDLTESWRNRRRRLRHKKDEKLKVKEIKNGTKENFLTVQDFSS